MTDRFTKFLLALIAAALVAIALNPWLSPGRAGAGLKRPQEVNLVEVGGRRIFARVPVELN